ncbi:MAG: hypothetical protein SFW65_00195 [Alphaproteobacteria bacterium]|nr:hypothetical protein [Alphaproteobacteria bacterium]
MNWNKQTIIICVCVVVLLIGIGYVITRKSDIETQPSAPVVANEEKPSAQTAEKEAETPAEKAAESAKEPVKEQVKQEPAQLPLDENAAQETKNLEKSLGIKGKDALARTVNFVGVPGKQMTTIIFVAQDKMYKMDIANTLLYSCKLASAVTYFTIKRAALGAGDTVNGADAGDLHVYGSDTSKPPTVCKLN